MSTDKLSAANTTWTGNVNHNWFNAGNWDNGVPGLLDTVSVLSDSVVIAATTDIKHLIFSNAAIVITPSGKLRIIDSDGIGINCLNARFYNHGLIRVNGPDGIGIHLTGTSFLKNLSGSRTIIDHSSLESVKIEANSLLENSSNGLVQSDTCTGSVHNSGELRNGGTINLVHSLTGITANIASLENHGTVVNNGLIEIDSSTLNGIDNVLMFTNNGTIDVHNVAHNGFNCGEVFENNGTLVISRANRGLLVGVNDSLTNTGNATISDCFDGVTSTVLAHIENSGTLMIQNMDNIGITNFGRLNNSGNINIESWGSILLSSAAISNADTLYNDTSGKIFIDGQNIGGFGIFNIQDPDTSIVENHGDIEIQSIRTSGIFNFGKVSNYKTIDIHDLTDLSSGISNHSIFENSDSLIINEVPGHGIFSNNILRFEPGSKAYITNCGLNGINNIVNASLINSGILWIHNITDNGILNIGEIQNMDSIIISNTESQGISTRISFTNYSTGVIQISDIKNSSQAIINGTASDTVSLFSNKGRVNVYDIDHHGIDNQAIFQNDGFILIDSTQQTGLTNNHFFNNADTLIIMRTGGNGLYNQDTLYNQSEGYLDISFTNENVGIFNAFEHFMMNNGNINIRNIHNSGFVNSGELINNQTITIDSVRQFGILNSPGSLINNTTATIEVSNVDGDIGGALLFNEANSSLINDGNILLSNLNIANHLTTAGIICVGGSTLHIASNGSIAVMNIMNMNDLIQINGNAIFQVDGTLDIHD